MRLDARELAHAPRPESRYGSRRGRQVQLELIRSGNGRAHPFYWAAFIVSGDDSTLAGEPPRLPGLGPRHGGCACDAADSRSSLGLALLVLAVACALRRRPMPRQISVNRDSDWHLQQQS